MKISHRTKKILFHPFTKSVFWFFIGAFLGLFFLVSSSLIIFQKSYSKTIYPGVSINGIDFGGKMEKDVQRYFDNKNAKIAGVQFVFTDGKNAATVSAEQIKYGYNTALLAQQAMSIGRSPDILSNLSLITQAYLYGINLPPSYKFSDEDFENFINPLAEKINIAPVEALFNFQNGRVTAFQLSSDGQTIDKDVLKKELLEKAPRVLMVEKPQTVVLALPIITVKPKVTTDKANNLGIKELIGSGTSLFQGSIPSRMYNISLASSRINGILVEPGETFSFDKALGDISTFTGYQQAYVIENGRTVLGDGGGVCQVSTTLFRALLNAGLPIVERHGHAYRVGYYEQDSPPGFDATIYVPSVDLKFKNDTQHYILIQTSYDPTYARLTFMLYGTKDGRQVSISQPVITNQTPAPEPLYQDDPTLPKGIVKQVDYAAPGATVNFTRQVTKNGKVILNDTFTTNFTAWRAVYLRGTM